MLDGAAICRGIDFQETDSVHQDLLVEKVKHRPRRACWPSFSKTIHVFDNIIRARVFGRRHDFAFPMRFSPPTCLCPDDADTLAAVETSECLFCKTSVTNWRSRHSQYETPHGTPLRGDSIIKRTGLSQHIGKKRFEAGDKDENHADDNAFAPRSCRRVDGGMEPGWQRHCPDGAKRGGGRSYYLHGSR
jgi:hypothetical protein